MSSSKPRAHRKSWVGFDFGAAAALIAILVVSLLPPDHAVRGTGSDTANHLFAYAVLTSLALLNRNSRQTMILAIVGVLVLGALLEVIQPIFAREADPADVAANLAGILLGVIGANLLRAALLSRLN